MGIKWNKKMTVEPIADKTVEPIADKIDDIYRKFAIDCYNNVIALSPVRKGRYKMPIISALAQKA